MVKSLLLILAILVGLFASVFYVHAAPTANIFRNVWPETTNTYDLGSTLLGWKRLFFATSTAGCATYASSGELISTGVACGTGSGGGGTPGGSDTQVQFNDSGSFGGSSNFVFDKTTPLLTLGADLNFLPTNSWNIKVKDQSSADTSGGNLTVQSGKGNGTGSGGALQLKAGNGGDSGGAGNSVSIYGGNAQNGDYGGGSVDTIGGSATGDGNGGAIGFTAGAAAHAGTGGKIRFITGSGGVAGGNAGNFELIGNDAGGGNADGGSFQFQTGLKSGSGSNGVFSFYPKGGTTVSGILNFDSLASSNKTFTFPNTTGTVCLRETCSTFGYPFPSNATTTSLTFGGTQTFTNSPIFSSLGAGTVNSTSAGTVYNTATSTPTVTAPITYSGTLGQFMSGVSGTFGCTSASAGVTGCLTGTDWSTFNNKISSSSLSGASVISYDSSTGVITTTPGTFAGGSTYTFPNDITLDSSGTLATGIKQNVGNGAGLRNIFFVGSTSLYAGPDTNAGASSGSDNVYLGYKTGTATVNKNRNTFVGSLTNSGVVASGAADQTALGYSALLHSRGNGNIGIGSVAAASVTSGTFNIGIGDGVDFPSNSGSGQLNIGNVLFGTGLYQSTTSSSAPTTGATVGISSSTPFAQLSVHAPDGATNTTLFAVGSSTASATTTLFSIDNTGSTTASNGFNITSGCFALNGTCLSTSGGGVTSIGGTGQALTGAVVLATSTSLTNGITSALTITCATLTCTFTPSQSGTRTVAGGGTGVATFTSSQLLYGNGTNALTSVATTSLAVGSEFSYSGTLGALVGGASGTLTLTANGTALTKLAQIAANSILGNNTGSTGNVVAFATSSLGIALSDTTGTLGVSRGGTGATIFGQGWINSSGGTNALTASTSPTVNYITATSTTATSTYGFSINSTAGGHATNGVYLSRIASTYSTSTIGTNVSVVFTGARDSAPAFAAGNLTLPNNTYSVNVEVFAGGGGGGGGPGTTGTGNTGGSGGQSCFGTNTTACTSATLKLAGGLAGGGGFDQVDGNGVGGAGGDGGTVTTVGDLGFGGQGGGTGATGTNLGSGRGAPGGPSPRGGSGGAGSAGGGANGGAGSAFGGGGGGGTGNNALTGGGAGGGGGAYSSKLLVNPSGTYYYTIGAGGTAGAAGTGGVNLSAGGVGGAGGIIFTVYTY